jgi:hypothetical protein
LRIGVTLAVIVSTVLQAAFFFDSANVACVLMALVVSLLYTRIFPRIELIQAYPLSTISAYMFGFTNMTLPLVVSTLELRPMARNLILPIEDFGFMAILAAVVVIVYQIYRASAALQETRQFLTRRINSKLGLFRAPDATQLWVLGAFGLLCLFYQAFSLSAKGAIGQGSIVQKIVVEMVPFAYAPFLIPLRSLYSRQPFQASKALIVALMAHFGIILTAAVLRNDRSDFAMVPVIVLFSVIVGVLTLRIRIRKVNYRVLVPVLFTILVVYPLLADMALAMYVVRRIYSKQGARQQIGLTWDMFQQRDKLHEYLDLLSQTKTQSYDESYYNKGNVFLERFANMKYHDNGLVFAKTFNERQRADLWDFTVGNALSEIPAPLLSVIGVQIDKKDYNTMSMGDYFYYLSTGRGVGGFRVGSYIAHGYVLIGYFFFPLFGVVMLGYFVFFDSLTHRFAVRRRYLADGGARIVSRMAYSTPIFAPIVLLNILSVLNPYRLGSFTDIPMFLLRGMPQQIVMYSLLAWGTRGASRWIDAIRGSRSDEPLVRRTAALSTTSVAHRAND